MSWKRLQVLSGLIFCFFLFLHGLTIFAAILDLTAFDAVLDSARGLYRPLEWLLVALPLGIHLLASVVLAFKRKVGKSSLLVRLSGVALFLLGIIHVGEMRLLPMSAKFSASSSFVAYTLESWPLLATSALLLLMVSGIVHAAWGGLAAVQELGGFKGASERTLRVTGWTWLILLSLVLAPGVGRIVLEKGNANPSFYPSYQRLFAKVAPFLNPGNPRVK